MATKPVFGLSVLDIVVQHGRLNLEIMHIMNFEKVHYIQWISLNFNCDSTEKQKQNINTKAVKEKHVNTLTRVIDSTQKKKRFDPCPGL